MIPCYMMVNKEIHYPHFQLTEHNPLNYQFDPAFTRWDFTFLNRNEPSRLTVPYDNQIFTVLVV